MSILESLVRRALDRVHRATITPSGTARLGLAVAMVGGVFASAFVSPVSVHADLPPDPAARVQVVVSTVHIYNDRDGWARGSGEMRLWLEFCKDGAPLDCASPGTLSTASNFSANTGDTVTIGHILPQDGDPVTGAATSEYGFPVSPGEHWVFRAHMLEDDVTASEDMGEVQVHVDAERGYFLGQFTRRSLRRDGSDGDFDVNFEVRRTPLPALRVNGISQIGTGAQETFCITVDNVGPQPAYLSPVSIRADGVLIREPNLGVLGSNERGEHCILRSELPAQQHLLRVVVDESHQVIEGDEVHPPYEVTILPQVVAASPEPGPTVVASPEPAQIKTQPDERGAQSGPNGGKADLTVKAILPNGMAPDGKDDCHVGKNTVTVVLKNAGAGDAGAFGVRLNVDDDDFDATADGLKAGQEREVKFENVTLKKGQHTFKAVADPEHAVSEAKDNNNELKISARCTDAA